MDQDDVARVALQNAETNGIVFLDELDKICAKSRHVATCEQYTTQLSYLGKAKRWRRLSC